MPSVQAARRASIPTSGRLLSSPAPARARNPCLIFANIGIGLTLGGKPVLDPTTYPALVVVVVVTTS